MVCSKTPLAADALALTHHAAGMQDARARATQRVREYRARKAAKKLALAQAADKHDAKRLDRAGSAAQVRAQARLRGEDPPSGAVVRAQSTLELLRLAVAAAVGRLADSDAVALASIYRTALQDVTPYILQPYIRHRARADQLQQLLRERTVLQYCSSTQTKLMLVSSGA
jgi:hypothetical protein